MLLLIEKFGAFLGASAATAAVEVVAEDEGLSKKEKAKRKKVKQCLKP
jgi:hypothetical protein